MDGGCVRNQRGGSVVSEEKQIEEMARFVCSSFHGHHDCENCSLYEERCCVSFCAARRLYNASYRKQSEGEWEIKTKTHQMFDDVDEELYVECPFCKRTFWVPYEFDDEKTFEYAREHYPYCNCGAKMGGGAE